MRNSKRYAVSSLDRAGYAIGWLSCAVTLSFLLLACRSMSTEEMLTHKAIVCVFVDGKKVCKEKNDD